MAKKRVNPKPQRPKVGFYIPGPDEINQPPENLNEYMQIIYGTKAIGKSTLASTFPDNLTLMFETRRRNLKIRQTTCNVYSADQIIEGSPDQYVLIRDAIPEILDDESIKTITFDSIDLFYDCVVHHVAAEYGVSNPSKLGKDSSACWIEIRNTFKAFMDTLADSRLGVIMTSHIKDREIEAVDGEITPMLSPSCAPACLQYVKQACDIAYFYGYYNGQRAIMIRDPNNRAWCANGTVDNFLQPDGEPLRIFAMPNDPTQGYNQLVRAFNNELWDIDHVDTDKPKRKGIKKKH